MASSTYSFSKDAISLSANLLDVQQWLEVGNFGPSEISKSSIFRCEGPVRTAGFDMHVF